MKSIKYKSYTLFFILILSAISSKNIFGQTNLNYNNLKQEKTANVFQKIEVDFSKGIISLDESVLYLTYSIFEPNKLPGEYQNLTRSGEPTWVFTKILRVWDSISESTKQELIKYGFSFQGTLSRPTFLNSNKESAHFKVFYSVAVGDSNAVSTIDENTDGTPDYVESILSEMENIWSKEIGTMGFTAPPGDSTTGGNSKYDIYLYKLAPNLYGFAAPDSLVGNNPNSTAAEINAYTSYIALRNEYGQFTNHSQLENIQVTAAHEFFHAVQFGYDQKEKDWLKEATAAWMEDEVYDDVNDNLQYLPNWFNSPSIPLDATHVESVGHWYGSWIFFRYVSEHLGGTSTIKKIWEKSIGHDSKIKDFSFIEINEALTEVNSSYNKAFKDFAVANLFKTIAPYNYEEGATYPNLKITEKFFQTKKGIKDSIKRHSSHYIRVFPNAIPNASGLDEIEFTVTPDDPTKKLEFIVTTKTSSGINVENPSLNGGKINYTLENSSEKDEIYAIIVNLDTIKTGFSLDITYKGNLIKLNNLGKYNYGFLSGEYYINRQFKETVNSEGNPSTDFIVSQYNLDLGKTLEFVFHNTNSGAAYQSKLLGDILFIVDNYQLNKTKYFGYHFNIFRELSDNFQIIGDPTLSYNRMFFYGSLFNPDFSQSVGIIRANLKTGNPQMILDLTDTDFLTGIIDGDRNSFVALNFDLNDANSDELILFSNEILRTFYSPDPGNGIRSVVYDDDFAAWGETDEEFSNGSIKAYDFTTNTLKQIRAINGVDPYSVATYSKRVVWWENTGSGAKIKLWMNDSTTTLRTTFKGLYLDDSGESSISFNIPMDSKGVAWMETDFILYYYNFESSSLNSYDLSSYFTDNLNTGYRVKLSRKNIIIQALSAVPSEKLGTYLFKLSDIATGVEDDNKSLLPVKFSLSQNYPNPFNPTTIINFQIPKFSLVTLKIYDILGREIRTLVNENRPAGNYKINFNAENLSSGIYLYRIIVDDFIQTKKMILLK